MSARDQAFTEGARLLEDAACDADWGKTPDFCAGLRAGAELLLAAVEKATAEAATATPTGPTGRIAQLLDAIRTTRGRWTTTRAAQFYRDNRIEPPGAQWSRTRTVARGDLRDLHTWGHLVLRDEPSNRHYTLNTRKDHAS